MTTINRGEELADVVVVSAADTVLLMVRGSRTERNEALIAEVEEALVSTGVPTDAIEVIWQGAIGARSSVADRRSL